MADDTVLSADELEQQLPDLPGWEVRDGWLCRQYKTPGFTHTMMLVNTIGYICEAAWHHPDLSIGYAHVTGKLQTHRVRAVTPNDIALARRIHETVTWKPGDDSPLDGFPKKWVR